MSAFVPPLKVIVDGLGANSSTGRAVCRRRHVLLGVGEFRGIARRCGRERGERVREGEEEELGEGGQICQEKG